jgi:polygalacturonase
MSQAENSRRKFLQAAGSGIAGASLTAGLVAQTKPTTTHGVFSHISVKDFGAAADGVTLDTDAINRAIAAAAIGGPVFFPAGKYLCHSIHLKSNVSLYLDQGATIIAADPSANTPTYDLAEPNAWDQFQDFGHSHWHNSLLWGEDIENVSILGPGIIWGRGLSRGWGAGPKAEDLGVANKAISLKNCHNVTLRDFSILHGGHFAILATGVDNLTIDNLRIDTNRDGMDIDCCRNVRVSNCSVNSPWDDGICLKSSFGLGYARATEAVAITNCYVTGDYEEGTMLDGSFKHFEKSFNVPRTGRIKFGTESNGGFKNITISNCIFEACGGLALETVDGGFLEDIAISNITMRDIVNAPIFLRLGSRMRGPKGTPVGKLRRVSISNVVCSGALSRLSCILSGIPGYEIEDVKLSHILIQHQGGGTQTAIETPENENAYPEPDMFGPMPAHGFYIRHVRGLEMSHVEIQAATTDNRPAMVFNDVKSIDLLRIKTPSDTGAGSFLLQNVQDFNLSLSRPTADTYLDHVDQKKL